jgi:putative addiction module component (TIGR02574 family)
MMSRSLAELEQEVLQLDLESRATLAGKLLGSLKVDHSQIDELWLIEAERRLAEFDSGLEEPIPGDEVFRRMRAQLVQP